MKTFVSAKGTGVVYEYLGGNNFRNLQTGEDGEVPTEVAQSYFYIPVVLNYLTNLNPNLLMLVESLGLCTDVPNESKNK